MSFETNRSGALLWHTSTLFDAGAVCHGFSTRPGGVSPAPWDSLNLGVGRGDTAENVQRISGASAPPSARIPCASCSASRYTSRMSAL